METEEDECVNMGVDVETFSGGLNFMFGVRGPIDTSSTEALVIEEFLESPISAPASLNTIDSFVLGIESFEIGL